MRLGFAVASLLGGACVFAADPRPAPPSPPIPPPQLPVRQYNAWQSIQAPLSRSGGNVLDENTITTPYFVPAGRLPIEPTHDALDIHTQSFPRPRLDTFKTDSARAAELDRREYELYLHAGLSDQSLGAIDAAAKLNAARMTRDQALLSAQEAYQAQLAKPGSDHLAANEAYLQQTRQIQGQYRAQRAQILGDPPATQSSR